MAGKRQRGTNVAGVTPRVREFVTKTALFVCTGAHQNGTRRGLVVCDRGKAKGNSDFIDVRLSNDFQERELR